MLHNPRTSSPRPGWSRGRPRPSLDGQAADGHGQVGGEGRAAPLSRRRRPARAARPACTVLTMLPPCSPHTAVVRPTRPGTPAPRPHRPAWTGRRPAGGWCGPTRRRGRAWCRRTRSRSTGAARGRRPRGGVDHVARAEGVDPPGLVGVGLAGVDRGPRPGGHDHVGRHRGDHAADRSAIGQVQVGRRAGGDQSPLPDRHEWSGPAGPGSRIRPSPGAYRRSLSGRHHSLAWYQATVSSSASSSVRCFFQPRAVTLLMSTE